MLLYTVYIAVCCFDIYIAIYLFQRIFFSLALRLMTYMLDYEDAVRLESTRNSLNDIDFKCKQIFDFFVLY